MTDGDWRKDWEIYSSEFTKRLIENKRIAHDFRGGKFDEWNARPIVLRCLEENIQPIDFFIGDGSITEKGLDWILKLRTLENVDLDWTEISLETAQKVVESWPNLKFFLSKKDLANQKKNANCLPNHSLIYLRNLKK
jgi:hypothetical protein